MTVPRTVLIDTDTASDDAVALIMALRSPAVRVAAITVVAGNVPVETGSRNALFVTELCGAAVPVFAGAAAPLRRPLETADWFHGVDGLGDHGYAPSGSRQLEALPADEAIIETVRAHPGIEIVTLGPLTNLALALAKDPRIAASISRCVVMGGAPCCEGNVTPAAEFNIWVDPEAARRVFHSGTPIEMVGWQLSRHDAVLSAADIDQLLALQTPLADFAIRCNSTAARAYELQTGEIGIALPDPIAMAIALDPALCLDASAHAVDIETASELTRGMTVVDRLGVSGDARNRAVWSAASTPAAWPAQRPVRCAGSWMSPAGSRPCALRWPRMELVVRGPRGARQCLRAAGRHRPSKTIPRLLSGVGAYGTLQAHGSPATRCVRAAAGLDFGERSGGDLCERRHRLDAR